jgi:imidazolonepropionase-like amidohydrolase
LQTIRAATSDAAITFGLFDSLGSITAGKLADMVIYPASVDLVNGDISQTRNIKYVTRGGRIWNADTMEEVWPVHGRIQKMPPINVD